MKTSKPQITLLAALFAAVLIALGIHQHATAAEPDPTQSKSAAEVTVNALAANPSPHLGKPVALVGVVGVITPGQGFVMVDHREYKACGLSCLREKETKKIPVRWNGAAPNVEDSVRVNGVLSKSAEGLAFTAQNWVKDDKSG